jgi:hypothetical protein
MKSLSSLLPVHGQQAAGGTFWQPRTTHRMSKRVYRALTEVKGLKDRMVWGRGGEGGRLGCGVVRLVGGKRD